MDYEAKRYNFQSCLSCVDHSEALVHLIKHLVPVGLDCVISVVVEGQAEGIAGNRHYHQVVVVPIKYDPHFPTSI